MFWAFVLFVAAIVCIFLIDVIVLFDLGGVRVDEVSLRSDIVLFTQLHEVLLLLLRFSYITEQYWIIID